MPTISPHNIVRTAAAFISLGRPRNRGINEHRRTQAGWLTGTKAHAPTAVSRFALPAPPSCGRAPELETTQTGAQATSCVLRPRTRTAKKAYQATEPQLEQCSRAEPLSLAPLQARLRLHTRGIKSHHAATGMQFSRVAIFTTPSN